MTSAEEVRAWAKRCAEVTRGRLPEYAAWNQLAERGEEYEVAYQQNGKPYRGGALMKPHNCFNNAARTALGFTAFDPDGCTYAEGFALSAGTRRWYHHAWVITTFGLVIERTWKIPGTRYAGVTFRSQEEFRREPGRCQLADFPLGIPWGPDLEGRPEAADQLFADRKPAAARKENQ
jgi:hypothetical protein